jgi:nucleoside-triphosphatase THEP1
MTLSFKKATKQQARLRLALIGPAGSGKTFTALKLASQLGQRVAVIDTEHGSAAKYADLFAFDVLELDTFSPRTYVEAIKAAEGEGYDVVVVDSLSHAWSGKDGALEQVDRAAKRQGGNSFGAWRDVTPQHNALVEAIVGAKTHIIATMRAKTEYVQEKDERGKTVVRKVGLAPVQREGLEFEFDVVGDLTTDNDLVITKTRCPKLVGGVFRHPGEEVATVLRAWLTDGAAREEAPVAPRLAPAEAPPADVSAAGIARLIESIEACASAADLGGLVPRLTEYKRAFGGVGSDWARIMQAYNARKVALGNAAQAAQ